MDVAAIQPSDSLSNIYWFECFLMAILYSKYSNAFLLNKIIELKNKNAEEKKENKANEDSKIKKNKQTELNNETALLTVINLLLNMQNVSREIQEKNKKLFNFELILIKIIKKLKKHDEIFKKIKGKNAGFTYLKNFVFDFYSLFDVNCLNITCFNKQDEPGGKFLICEPQEIKNYTKDEYQKAFDYNTEKLKTNPDVITIQYYLQDSSTLQKIKSKLNQPDSANYKDAINLKTYDSVTNIADFSDNIVFKRQNYKLDSFVIFNKEPKENAKDKSNCIALLNLKDNKVLYNGNLNFQSDSIRGGSSSRSSSSRRSSRSSSRDDSSEKCDDFISFDWKSTDINFKLSDENQTKDFFNNYLIVFIYVKDFNEETDKIYELKSRSINSRNFDSFNSISSSSSNRPISSDVSLSLSKSVPLKPKSSTLPLPLISSSSNKSNDTFNLSKSLPLISSKTSRTSNETNDTYDLSESSLPLSSSTNSLSLSLSLSSSSPKLITTNSEEKKYLGLPPPKKPKLKAIPNTPNTSSSSVHTSGFTEQIQPKSKTNSSRTSFIPSNITTLESPDSSSLKDNKFNRLPPQSKSNFKSKCNKKISLYYYQNSCYIDSLLVALFQNYNGFVFNYFIDADIQQYPFLPQEIQETLNDLALEIKDELINLILLISGKENEPRHIAQDTNNLKTTSFKLRTLIKTYLNTRWPDNMADKYIKDELDINDVFYALNEIFIFKEINTLNKETFSFFHNFKLGEIVNNYNDKKILINNYYNYKGIFKFLLIKIDRFGKDRFGKPVLLLNCVYPSETIINGDNIVFLRSIIIFVPKLKHYICLFKCGDFWYEYNNLATENNVEKTVSYFGNYETVFSNEEYMRNTAGFVYY